MYRCCCNESQKIGEEAIPILSNALKDKDVDVQAQAFESIKNIGKQALPALKKAMKQEKDPSFSRKLSRLHSSCNREFYY